ncbi:hypothetical protein LAM87_20210, partial [Mycobacterium tuberculosis]|nr:hypothetical protein [Mycobacterium tuberculosis]
LRSTPETSRRLRSQIRESPDSPGRFSLVIDRILGLSDSSITVLTRAQVEAMVAALPRSY